MCVDSGIYSCDATRSIQSKCSYDEMAAHCSELSLLFFFFRHGSPPGRRARLNRMSRTEKSLTAPSLR